jgi:oxygen-independent coproporphyrinogen-3 oxidase
MDGSSENEKVEFGVPGIVEEPCGLYPRIETFSSDYGTDDYCDWIEQSNGDPLPAPLVLYLQNEASSKTASVSDAAMAHAIEQELHLQGSLFDADRPLKQLICTGSIATDWNDDQLYRLVSVIQSSFYINPDSLSNWCACARGVLPSMQRLRLLRVLGFNHLRLVPESSAREALPVDVLADVLGEAKRLGFRTTILDLRKLTVEPVALQQALVALLADVKPDRIHTAPPPEGDGGAVDTFMASHGYQDIGLGWYLRTGDSWWLAANSDSLYWTMLGYGELHSPDIIGVGPGALSAVCDFYSINESGLPTYAASLDEGILPVARGIVLEDADVLRREIIAMVLASSCIRVSAIEDKWGIRFEQFFGCESELLRAFERNRWVRWQGERIEIRTRDYRALSEICRVFDGRNTNPLTHAAHPGGRSAGAAYNHTVNFT